MKSVGSFLVQTFLFFGALPGTEVSGQAFIISPAMFEGFLFNFNRDKRIS